MKPKRKSSATKKVLTALVAMLAVVFVLLLAATIYVEWILGKMYYDPNSQETLSPEQIAQQLQQDQNETLDPDASVVDSDDVDLEGVDKIEIADGVVNILLIGQDRRPGEPRARSDVMLLVTVNTKKNEVTLTSFMRDLYVQIPGYGNNRINVPFMLGGPELLMDTIELNFGIRPDKFVEVDFNGFQELVELVGGIDMELTELEAYHLNTSEESWSLKEGMNRLDGKQTLAYSRIRAIDPTADFARTERQRKVIAALIDRAMELNLIQLNELLLQMTEMISTDMTSREILSYARTLYPVLAEMDDVNSVRIPYENNYYSAAIEGVGTVLVPDLPSNSAVIAEFQK